MGGQDHVLLTVSLIKALRGRVAVGPGGPLNRVDYLDYLRSPEWKAKRRRAIERAGHVCEICGGTAGWK